MTAQGRRGDGGFSLVELLVIMLIVGVLVAIAIPIFLNQRAKAADSAAESDAVNLGLMIHTENTPDAVAKVERSGDAYYIDDEWMMPASDGVEVIAFTTDSASHWCVQLSHPDGASTSGPGVRYDSHSGLEVGAAC